MSTKPQWYIPTTTDCWRKPAALLIVVVNRQHHGPSSYFILLYFFSHCLPVVGLCPSSSATRDCMVPLRGDWAIFCHADSGRVRRVWSAWKKSLEILHHDHGELNPDHERTGGKIHDQGHGKDRQWDTLTLPLSYYDRLKDIANKIIIFVCINDNFFLYDFITAMAKLTVGYFFQPTSHSSKIWPICSSNPGHGKLLIVSMHSS